MKSPSLEAAPRQCTATRAAADWGRCGPSRAQAEGPVDTPEAKEKPKAAPEQKHKKAGKAGTKVYPIDANTTAQLQAYFAPHNAMLYKLLGRDLGWGPKRGT